jgi:hypothetical protein
MSKDLKCEDRVLDELKGRIKDLRALWKAYCAGDDPDPDLGEFHEYGLCIDYVAPYTFTDQRRGYLRYQLSTGGPGDEFRFFMDDNLNCYRVEYWFLDWYDGASIVLKGKQLEFMLEIFEHFSDCEIVRNERERALQDALL